MAASDIAFLIANPAPGAGQSPSRPVDLAHLARQTMGDKAVEVEVLQMFARQARIVLRDMAQADDAALRALAHKLAGAAGAVGAFRLSAIAMELENGENDPAKRAALAASVIETENFILKLCR